MKKQHYEDELLDEEWETFTVNLTHHAEVAKNYEKSLAEVAKRFPHLTGKEVILVHKAQTLRHCAFHWYNDFLQEAYMDQYRKAAKAVNPLSMRDWIAY